MSIKRLIKNKVVKNIFWNMSDSIVKMILGLIVGVWSARYLGPEKFGQLNYVMAIMTFFYVFSNLGIDGIVVKELVEKGEENYEILGTIFSLKFILSIFAQIILIFYSLHFLKDDKVTRLLFIIVSFSLPIKQLEIISYYFQSKLMTKYQVMSSQISLYICTLLKIVFIIKRMNISYFALLYVTDTLIIGVALVFYYKKNGQTFHKWSISKDYMKKIIKLGLPIMIATLISTLYLKLSQILVGGTLSKSELGTYGAVIRISELWYFIPTAIVNSAYVKIYKKYSEDKEDYILSFELLNTALILLSIIFAIFITIFSKYIVYILYGNEYIEAASILRIYVWQGVFVAVGLIISKHFMASGNTEEYIYISLFTAFINLLMAFGLIKKFGLYGAAFTDLFTQISTILYLGLNKKFRGLFFIVTKSFYNIFDVKYVVGKIKEKI